MESLHVVEEERSSSTDSDKRQTQCAVEEDRV